MPATNPRTGELEYVGQVVCADVKGLGSDRLVFITYTIEGYTPIGQPIFKFKEHFGGYYGAIVIDAPLTVIRDYPKIIEAERVFKQTIAKFQKATELGIDKDAIIFQGEHAGVKGMIYGIPANTSSYWRDYQGGLIELMLEDGQSLHVLANQIRVIAPEKYITGPVACIECYNCYPDIVSCSMHWYDTLQRPLCGFCADQYLDRGIELHLNRSGPFNE